MGAKMKQLLKIWLFIFCFLLWHNYIQAQNYFDNNIIVKSNIGKINYYRQDGSILTIDNTAHKTSGNANDMLKLFPMLYTNKTKSIVYYKNDSLKFESQNRFDWTKSIIKNKQNQIINDVNLRLFVSPNPASELLKIQVMAQKKANLKVIISDVYGSSNIVIFHKNDFIGDETMFVDIAQLALKQGIYLIRLVSDNEVITKKVAII